jgi:hypothetical protein
LNTFPTRVNNRKIHKESKKFNWNGAPEEVLNEVHLRQIYTRVYHVIDKVSNHFYQKEQVTAIFFVVVIIGDADSAFSALSDLFLEESRRAL